jgi:ATP-dependent Clp protease ATP-binding subunit ClpB
VEKAHQRVWNVFLQVLDEGHLTDGHGKTVDFSNTVIILTSNLGAEYLQNINGSVDKETEQKVMSLVRAHFRPEFLNRLDEIILFQPLQEADLRRIVALQASQLCHRLTERDTHMSLTPAALDVVLRESYNPTYGARPMRRFLEKHVMTALSRKIISNELPEHSTVIVDAASKGTPGGLFSFLVQTTKENDPPVTQAAKKFKTGNTSFPVLKQAL